MVPVERKDSGRGTGGNSRTRDGIVVIGDTHGNNTAIFKALNKHQDTNLIHVGDLGIGFRTDQIEKARMRVLDKEAKRTNCHLYILRGNHDNPAFWNEKELIFKNITFVKDRSLLEISHQKIYFLGGGVSIDRQTRTENATWWKGEQITEPVKTERMEVDILITHSGLAAKYIPDELHDISKFFRRDLELKKDLKREQSILLDLEQDVKSKLWICGHFHVSATHLRDNRTFIFLGINEVRPIALQNH